MGDFIMPHTICCFPSHGANIDHMQSRFKLARQDGNGSAPIDKIVEHLRCDI